MLRPRYSPLFNAAEEHGLGSGGAPTIMQQIKAAVADKAKLQASLDEANGTVAQLTTEATTAATEIEKLKAEIGKHTETLSAKDKEITDLKAEHTKALEGKDGEITQLKQQATTVQDELTALGISRKELPPKQPQGSSKEDKLADLAAKAAATTDPVEKGKLAAQQWDEMWK